MKEIVMLMGFQGSGKSTLVSDYTSRGYARLNRDNAGKSASLEGLLPAMEMHLKQGQSVVLDNTYLTAADRKPVIERGKKAGATDKVVHINTPFEDCQINVCIRMVKALGHLPDPAEIKKSKDPAIIPPAAMFAARKAFEKPLKTEGMDAIEIVPFTRVYDLSYTGKAILLDFDGCLRECPSGAHYPCSTDDIRILPGRKEKLLDLVKQGYRLLGVSNQSGIAKGDLTDEQARSYFEHTIKELGVPIEIGYCPHRIPPMSCWCRKPQSGLGVAYIEKYKLDPRLCIMVGDMTTDKTFATRLGMGFVDAAKFFA